MLMLSDAAFYAKEGNPMNRKLCDSGLGNT